jgi:hypothetical protein
MSLSPAAPPASTSEAVAMLTSAMRYLAAADATPLTASEQAECLAGLEQADAIETAARASVLGAFTAGQGYCEDADYSPRAWLIHKTRVTKGAATGHAAWVRRARAHPRILAALADGEMSESCGYPRRAPSGVTHVTCASPLVAAAFCSVSRARSFRVDMSMTQNRRSQPQPQPQQSQKLKITTNTVLEALSAPRGAGDTRSHEQ